MKYLRRIIALISILAIFSSLFVVSASAAVSTSVSVDPVGLFDWAADYGRKFDHAVGAWFDSSKCGDPSSPNGLHNFVSQRTTVDGETGLFYICEYCGKSAGHVFGSGGHASAGSGASRYDGEYQQYVEQLPASSYASDNTLIWKPTVDDITDGNLFVFPPFYYYYKSINSHSVSDFPWTVGGGEVSICEDRRSISYHIDSFVTKNSNDHPYYLGFAITNSSLTAPIDGSYTILSYPAVIMTFINQSNEWTSYRFTAPQSEPMLRTAGGSVCPPVVTDYAYKLPQDTPFLSMTAIACLPVYQITPTAASAEITQTLYDQSTRMGNIGGNYGTVNNDNSVTQYTTQYIVNEAENTYTNPATGETQTIVDWTYDYGDRSYDLTLEGGQTSTVTYGDREITISDNSVNNEGDTITNNYTINYIVKNGSEDPDPSASPSPSADPGGGGGSGSGSGTTGGGSVNPLSRVFANYAANITQNYGNDGHGGTDCIPSSGAADTVTAHSEGEVVWVQTGQENNQGSSGGASYGNAVKIKHSNGYYTLYAHLATVEVSKGQHVYKAQPLGMMGNTGNSYGAHLHFEVRDASDARINSDPYLNADLPGLEGGGKSEGDRSIWDKLGDLIGTGVNGVLGLVETALSKILDGLISLLEMLMERLKTVVETILSVFDALPALFGGFLDLLGKLFPFLPPEITTLLTFGVIAVVVIWIIKAFKS